VKSDPGVGQPPYADAVRLAVYCDYSYQLAEDGIRAELPFALFVQGLAAHVAKLTLLGRLREDTAPRLPFAVDQAELVALPHYHSGAHIAAVLRAFPASLARFWSALAQLDVVWVLGPNPPQALAFALATVVRRRRLVLGVRQDLPRLIRHRHPSRPSLWLYATLLEGAFRLLARRVPVVVVGPELARRYRRARAVHVAYVSLLRERRLQRPRPKPPDWGAGELHLLSVGRLDPEKNPLALVDVLEQALRIDRRWRLHICGEGSMRGALEARLRQRGLADRAVLHGYVPIEDGLWELYERAHALLHVSHTEGVPQVLLEAFAAGLPVVATDVGGVRALVAGRGLLFAAGDAAGAAAALARLAADEQLRATLTARALQTARDHTLEAECARLADFLGLTGRSARQAARAPSTKR